MSDLERAEYEELARIDKERFERESEVRKKTDRSIFKFFRQETKKFYDFKKSVVVKMQ